MELVFKSKALQDIEYWKRAGQKQIQQKISVLLSDILAHPYSGLGKPESLKYDLAGFWSRRISYEDRIIYRVDEVTQVVYIVSMRGHYEL